MVEARDLADGTATGDRRVVRVQHASVSAFRPPKALTCAVIGNPENGASTIEFAQFDLGGVTPDVFLSISTGF